MKRRNTMTAAGLPAGGGGGVPAAGHLLLRRGGKFEALLKTFLRERDVMAFAGWGGVRRQRRSGSGSPVHSALRRGAAALRPPGGGGRGGGKYRGPGYPPAALNFVDLQAAPGVGPQVAENAAATAAFAQCLEALGIPYLYVNAPQKLQRGEALLPDRGGGVRQRRAPTRSWRSWSGRERTMWTCALCLRRTASTPTGFSAPTTTGSPRRPFSPGRR